MKLSEPLKVCSKEACRLTAITKKIWLRMSDGEDEENVYDLSGREKDVLKLMTQGMNNVEIAQKLFISRFTVETHLRNIFDKLDIHSRQKFLVKAIPRIRYL